jgi:putative oxidoreductase
MSFDKFALRTIVGGLMMGHGLQKLNGSFDGPGLEGVEQMMGSIGMHPAKHQARAAALSETIGGGLTAAGFLSPLGPAMIMGTMAVAINKVHLKNGVWVSKGGFEYNLTLIAASFALAAEGPGLISVDGLLGKQRSGLKWGLFAAGLGLGAAAAALRAADRYAPQTATSSTSGGHGTADEAAASGHEHHEHHAHTAHTDHTDHTDHGDDGHDGHEHHEHESASSGNGN